MSKHHGVLSRETLAHARADAFALGDTCYAGDYGGPFMVYLGPPSDPNMSGWVRLASATGPQGERGAPGRVVDPDPPVPPRRSGRRIVVR